MAYAQIANDLVPFNPPLGPQQPRQPLYNPNPVTLVMKEKILSWSGDDFSIRTTDGLEICRCSGKVFSLHNKHKFTDPQGNEIFTLSKKLMKLFSTFVGESVDGTSFEVKGQFKMIGSRSTVTFKNASDGANLEMEVVGKWATRKADITLNGRPVAHIKRDIFNARNFWTGQDTYFITVAPNVDLSLIAAICVCLDEREQDNK